ncbi:MAG: sulfotransferase [Anaerolineae bacterium]|nr:sulfotransferase [Anaerolineae bacterium]
MNQGEKLLIVVLGMHRSGTSVMSRALKVMGVDLGNNLLSGMEGENEKGFWEDIDILNLNDEMLSSLSSTWYDLLPITVEDVEKLKERGFFYHAINLLQNKMKDVQIFGLKDPRFAKLLLFWKQVFIELNVNVSYIITVRNPLSVSQSLHKRNKIPHQKSLLMWLDHIVASLDQSQNEKRILVDYDLLMENPEKTIRHIADTFNLSVDSEQLYEFKNEFLDSRLRHTIFTTKDLVNNLSIQNVVSQIYLELLKGHLSKNYLNNPIFYAKLAKWKEYINLQEQSWRLINIIDAQYSQALAQLAERDAQLQEIIASKAWKILLVMRKIWLFFPGPRSKRTKQ